METERDPPKLCDLVIDSLSLRLENRHLIEGFSLRLCPGTRIGITGPSGCGKTTLLRSIVGRQITSPSTVTRFELSVDRVGYVPQQGGLLPWFSLRRNLIVFSQYVTGDKDAWCDKVLQWMELEGAAETSSQRLSGGELQRARLACAIVSRPGLFCADEPLTEVGLQQKWRILRRWSNEMNATLTSLLLVSHDVETLFYLCDEIIVLDGQPGQPATQVDRFFLRDQPHPRVPEELDSSHIKAFLKFMSRDQGD